MYKRQALATTREKGRDAERLAEAWLAGRGYVVLARNHATRAVAAATDWARRNGALDEEIRFDVLAVSGTADTPGFELFQGAFDASGGATP